MLSKSCETVGHVAGFSGFFRLHLLYDDDFQIIKTHLRNMIIIPEMIGSMVGVYNGKVFNQIEIKVHINYEMLLTSGDIVILLCSHS